MKIAISLFFILLLPFAASAHPGKTDARRGHKCWQNCGDWELQRGEYHLHDKDLKPIRLDQKGNILHTEQAKGVPPEKLFLRAEPSAPALKPPAKARKNSEGNGVSSQDTVEKRYAVTVYAASILPANTILLILLAFLLLIVLILLWKKRKTMRRGNTTDQPINQ